VNSKSNSAAAMIPASTQEGRIPVYDLAMRMLQLEKSLGMYLQPGLVESLLGYARSQRAAGLLRPPLLDVANPIHHRAFARQRLQSVLHAIQLDPKRADLAGRPESTFQWRSKLYPVSLTRAELRQAITQTFKHPNESDHRAAALMDAMQDAEGEMGRVQADELDKSYLEVSRAALRGAYAVAAAVRANLIERETHSDADGETASGRPERLRA
jgi:hypothetical protein